MVAVLYKKKGIETETEVRYVRVLTSIDRVGLEKANRHSMYDHIEWVEVSEDELPLSGGKLILTGRMPVVSIYRAKSARTWEDFRKFLLESEDFRGGIITADGGITTFENIDTLWFTDRSLLRSGARISGGRPVVELTGHRWLRDGRYVADRCRLLHGRTLETIEREVEQEPGSAEEIVQAIVGRKFPHRLYDVTQEATQELQELEGRRVMLTGEQARKMSALVHEQLVVKFREAGVRFVRDIPEGLTVATNEVAPELVSERDTLGTLELPGMGRRLLEEQYASFGSGDRVPTVELSIEEFRQIESWPFEQVFPVLTELGDTYEQLDSDLRSAVRAPEGERVARVREIFSRRWTTRQRSSNWPKDEKVANPLEIDPPATPESVIWGFDLMTGEGLTAHAALVHSVHGVRGGIVDNGWYIRWYDDAREAAEADAEARREAESYITARKLEADLTAEAEAVELPVRVPTPFTPFTPALAQVMERLGFTAEQFRIEGEGPISVCVSPESGYHSEIRDRYVVLERAQYTDHWWDRDEEGIVVFANTTIPHLIGEDSNWGAAGQLGVGKEKIQAVRDWLAAEGQKAERSYRAQVREFVESLQRKPAYASVPSNVRAELVGLADSFGLPNLSRIADELRREWAKAETLHRRVESGEILTNFGGRFRVMGATDNAQYWVVMSDGSEREPDEVSYHKRYTSEGEKKWRLVGPQELAISWSKAYTAADHKFVVDKLPVGGCTTEQLATIERLEREISERFAGATGMSGTSSPEIGVGWGLQMQSQSAANLEAEEEVPAVGSSAKLDADELADRLAALRAKFGK